jgi:hypothetical protein
VDAGGNAGRMREARQGGCERQCTAGARGKAGLKHEAIRARPGVARDNSGPMGESRPVRSASQGRAAALGKAGQLRQAMPGRYAQQVWANARGKGRANARSKPYQMRETRQDRCVRQC